jgi:dephospho-CoA kinase
MTRRDEGGFTAFLVVFYADMRTVRVGLTGGIGSGKSTVAELWRERGALIIDADVLARDVVAPDSDGIRAIAARWPAVVAPDSALDRAALAQIVFHDDVEREALNAIIHPRVRDRSETLEARAPAGTIAVHVIPLLFEGDYWKSCAATVVVFAPPDERLTRVVKRDGANAEGVLARMRAQIDPAEARDRATYAIENDADLTALRERANAVYDRLLELR